MDQEVGKRIDLRVYWRILWRRKVMVVLPVIVVTGTAIVGSFHLPPVYRSSSAILVEQNTSLPRSLENILPRETRFPEREIDVRTIATKIKSPVLLRRVVSELHPEPDSLSLSAFLNHVSGDSAHAVELVQEQMVTSVARSISVSHKSPSVFEISVDGEDPERVYRVAQLVTDLFVQDALETQLEEVHSMYELSISQLAFYEERLAAAEEELKKFRQSLAKGSIAETPVDSTNVASATTLLSSFVREYESLLDEVDSYSATTADMANSLLETELLKTLKGRLRSLSAELPALLVRYDWTAPAVLTANGRIRSAKEEIKNEIERIAEHRFPGASLRSREMLVEYEAARIDAESMKVTITRLRQLIGEYEKNLVAAPTEELKLARLEQEVESNRQIYNMLLEQSKAANLSKALEYVKVEARYRVIDDPQKPLYPVKPEKPKIAGMAFLIGVILGLGLAFLREYMDHSLKTIEDVESYVGLPVLGTIPRVAPGGKRWKT